MQVQSFRAIPIIYRNYIANFWLTISDVTFEDVTIATGTAYSLTCSVAGLSGVDEATISITSPAGASWTLENEYTTEDGDFTGGTQESVMVITAAALTALGTTSTFTCLITSAVAGSEESSTEMTLVALTFSKQIVANKFIRCSESGTVKIQLH